MALTADQLILRCAARFRDTAYSIVTAQQWDDYLGDAQRWLQTHAAGTSWPYAEKSATVTVLAGVATVNFPAGFMRLRSAFNSTDRYQLRAVNDDRQILEQWPPGEASQGAPIQYRALGTKLEVYPTPTVDTDVALVYVGDDTLFTANVSGEPTDTSDVDPATIGFPDALATVFIEYALYLAYVDDENDQAAQAHLAAATDLIEHAVAQILAGRSGPYPALTDSWFSG